MNPLTDRLRDIHLPEAIGAWPPAPGWWLAGGLLLVTIGLAAAYARWHWRRGRARRRALAALEQCDDMAAINAVLKRAALAYFPRQQVASLSGAAWFEFLDRQLPSGPLLFSDQVERWQQQLYAGHSSPQQTAHFARLARQWLRRALPSGTGRKADA